MQLHIVLFIEVLPHLEGFFRVCKHLSPTFKRKRLSEVNRPMSLWTSFTVFEDTILAMAWFFLGFTSIPCYTSIKPKNFLDVMLKTHLLGFRFISYYWSTYNISFMFVRSSFNTTLTSQSYRHVGLNIPWGLNAKHLVDEPLVSGSNIL